jgi:hemerythrin-like domain-containing protein
VNIDKFKHQHLDILAGIDALRRLVHGGIAANADAIAARIVAFSGLVKLHLAVEDRTLYPALEMGEAALARMSRLYQNEMQGIVGAYFGFAARWNTARHVAAAPEQFRTEANVVLRQLHERIRREDREFYPAIESELTPA